MQFVNSNIARKIGRHHGWRERFWARRYQAIVVSEEDAAQLGRLYYLLEHGCKEGLVASPEEWPGNHCVHALLEGHVRIFGTWHDATAEYHDRRKGRKIDPRRYRRSQAIFLTPLPALRHLSKEAQIQTIRGLVEDIREKTRRRHQENGTQPLGIQAILTQEPRAAHRRSKRSPAPRVGRATAAA